MPDVVTDQRSSTNAHEVPSTVRNPLGHGTQDRKFETPDTPPKRPGAGPTDVSPRPHTRSSRPPAGHAHPKIQLSDIRLDIPRAQKSEAWTRIRAVSRIPVEIKAENKKKQAKKVRWGVVQTRVFESEPCIDGGCEATPISQHRDEGDEINGQGKRGQESGVDADREGKEGREIWAAVEREGMHERWGPTEGSDGQLR